MVSLPVLNQVEGAYCEGCTYQETGVRNIGPDGTGANGIWIVGDSPWIEEVRDGRPFVGASGRFLDSILSKRGLKREDFLIVNGGTWCKPPFLGMNDEPWKHPETEKALQQCRPYLDDLVEKGLPRVFIAAGNVALRRLTGFEGVEENHSYILQTPYDIPCIPTFHPSSLIQGNWNLTIAFILAIARAGECADGSFRATKVNIVEDPDPSYIVYPGNGDIETPLMCDIETPKSLKGANEEEAEDDPSYTIERMGFSVTSWQGVSFPYSGDYIRRAKELIRRAKVLLFWNKNYDLPRLKANGFTFHPDVTIIDAMWAWHWLYSDLPKALAFAAPFFYSGPPWKHLASQRPAYYNAMDNAVQMGIYQGVKKQLEADGRWDRFWNHCVKVDPIYVRMGGKGVKVDRMARATFMEALEVEAKKELIKVQELLPPKLIKVEESFKKLSLPKLEAKAMSKRLHNSLVRIEVKDAPAVLKDGGTVPTIGGGTLVRPLYRRISPFNPNSRPDLINLMHELKVKVPKARGEDRESTEAKYLKRITKHPIFRHCINYKQRVKLVSTYNWPLDDEDRAHTTYGYNPSTWRSSSRNVNLGNIPKRFDLAKLFRRLLIAEKGHKLIEIDRSAIEAVLVGYWAKSLAYIKLAKAGVHSYLVSHVVGDPVPWKVIQDTPLKDLQKLLKGFKKAASIETYEGCKRCIHSSNYLISPFGLHDEYEEFFPTEYDAEKMQGIYFGTEAGRDVRAWHKATIEEVHAKKLLDNNFEYRHYFFGPLYKFNKRENRWGVDPEGDAKRAVGFRPQSDAAAIQREDLLALEPIEWFSRLLRLPTYDSIVAECPIEYVDRGCELLAAQFAKPIAELQGLKGYDGTIGFEIKVGDNLADMEEVSL